jgi:hypothetical protein
MSKIQRRFALLISAALLALAVTAPSAVAATTVKALNGTACPAVSPAVSSEYKNSFGFAASYNAAYTSGGCTVHVTSYDMDHIIGKYAFGPSNRCRSAFDVHVGPDGWGYANNFVFTNCTYPTTLPAAAFRTRVIAPAEFLENTSSFPEDDAATDLKMSMRAAVNFASGPQEYTGVFSVDVDTYNAVTQRQIWKNQRFTASSEFPYSVAEGRWSSLNQGLIITH